MTSRTNRTIDATDLAETSLHEIDYVAHGLRIRLAVSDPRLHDLAREELPPGDYETPRLDLDVDRFYRMEHEDGPPAGYYMTVDGERSGPFLTAEVAIERLESSLQIYVAEFAYPDLFLHAGVVQWLGMTIVLPGSSYAGKSTLTRALVNEGAVYFSDEFAVLNLEGRVRPYARKLSHRAGPLGPTGRINLDAHAPNQDDSFVRPTIDVVALIRYEEDSVWNATRLLGGEAVLAVSEHMVAIRNRPKDSLDMLVNVIEGAQVYRCTRPDLESALDWFRSLARERATGTTG